MSTTDPQDQTAAAPGPAGAPMDWFIVHTYSGFEDRVVLELTNRYLGARFGGNVLSDEAAREYEKMVRDIRTYKAPPPPAQSAP